MAVAAGYWEDAIRDAHTLTIDYGWFTRTGSTTATHQLTSEGGSPHREISASIAFDNDGSNPWFLDATPWEASEFASYQEYTSDEGGGVMNIGLEYTGGSGVAAEHDLFSTAIHEIGHALGLSSANDAFTAEAGADRIVDVFDPLPFGGADLSIDGSSAHLTYSRASLYSSRASGVRRLLSDADILANAEISQFTNVNLNPTLIPEPSAFLLAGVSLVGIACGRSRKNI